MAKKILKRAEVDPKNKWKIEDIFATDEDCQILINDIKNNLSIFEKYKNKLGESCDTLLKCLDESILMSMNVSKVYIYSNLRFYEDTTNTFYKEMSDKTSTLTSKFSDAVSFINPEILAINEDKLRGFMQEENGIKLYTHFLNDLIRQNKYVLSDKEEALLAKAQEVTKAPDDVYTMMQNADLKFGNIMNEDGEEIELTFGNFILFLESTNREVRKNAYTKIYTKLRENQNTYAALYAASVNADNFISDVRKYDSALQMALYTDNVSPKVYSNLIDAVHNYIPNMHKYIALRKKKLDLDELYVYDLYTPIVKDADTKMTYEVAQETVLAALAPLGAEYVVQIKNAYTDGWIDVYENVGKRSGAFAWGVYDAHPFVCLNHCDKLSDAFTLAHELGHAMHSFYTWGNQPMVYSDYTIFLAEVASTVNECLLLQHLLKTTTDKVMKEYLLNYYAEMFRGTIFRQTMFAEFESICHDLAKDGISLTNETLCTNYKELCKKYYGDAIILDDNVAIEWARIPHFYSAFYVYKYATGLSIAVAFSKKILNGNQKDIDDYFTFLKSGGSNYSTEILKSAGIDMESPKTIEDALEVFADLISEMEKI